jgi:outer membrane protein OmpA-like peptidoglycan-associated protein
VGIPENYMGTQAASSGNHYAGIITYYSVDQTDWNALMAGDLSFPERQNDYVYAEYLQVDLKEPLTAGQVYNISFKASLAEKSAYTTRLGAYVSENKLDETSNENMNLEPQVVSNTMVYNTDGWEVVSGTYTAKGGERYVTIGRFGGMEKQKIVGDNETNSRKAYYYISEPSVTPGVVNLEVPVVVVIDFDDLLDGKSLCLPNLNFETGSARILPESYTELNSLADWMLDHPDIKLQVDGHTDKTGTDEFNLELSKNRAASVKTYLVGKGVNAESVDTEGYGSMRPIDKMNISSLTNRRVEICLKK